MSPRWDGKPTYKDRVWAFFAGHENEWFTAREAADAMGEPAQDVRSAIALLVQGGFLIRGTGERVTKSGKPTTRRTFRTRRGYLSTSKFEPRRFPGVIWVGSSPIVGPFCQHCGNPDYMHGPQGECLNYRIHPLLPPGDLPPARLLSP